MTEIANLISTVGFPIAACIGLGWFCKYMIDKNNQNIDRMFGLYEKSNTENREAIEKLTVAVDKLCDKIDKEE
ncbi:MAG: hypothetical protein VZR53_08835 [Prevotella sp.]|nr:hypothetical protein [Prevotella sp.]